LPYTRSYICVSHFSCLSVFLALLQVLQCAFLIFLVFLGVLPCSRS
jgi:hypothetical protein